MAIGNEKSALSFERLGIGAVLFIAVAALFGVRTGDADSGKSGEKSVAGKTEFPSAALGLTGAQPHRAYLVKYLQATARQPTPEAAPASAAKVRMVLIRLVLGGLASERIANALLGPSSSAAAARQPIPESEARRVNILIATVPDPIDTAFGFWFDQVIEGLTRAVCDTELYAPVGFWNPWEEYRAELKRKEAKAGEEATPEPLFLRVPGVLLFRGTKETDRVLAVLLVSENPNSVKAEPLQQALDLAGEIQQIDKPGSPLQTVRLIAPVFTGSQPSLFRALEQWHKKNGKAARFDVVSGSAIGLARLSDQEREFITLHAAGIPSLILCKAAIHFWQHKRCEPEEDFTSGNDFSGVAFLVESNTGFGRAFPIELKVQKEIQKKIPEQTPKEIRAQQWPMYLPYPLHVSRLQATYAQKRLEIEKRLSRSAAWLDRKTGERSVRPNPELIASLDESVTAPINDRALEDITATIRQNPVRLVGIIATDPEDKVFLVERIKKDCPGVEIFITGMEQFYSLPENRQAMRGVLVTTTYSLYPPNQGWCEPDEARRQFLKSPSGQGTYNAAGFHLSAMVGQVTLEEALQEYAPPVFAVDRNDPTRKPPVWIVTIGENGRVVPVAFFNNYETPINNQAAAGDLVASAPPPSGVGDGQIALPELARFRMAALLVTITAVVVLLRFLWPRPPSLWVLVKSSLVKITNTAQEACVRERVGVYLNLILFALTISAAATLRVTALLIYLPFRRPGLQMACFLAIAVVLGGALLASLGLQTRIFFAYCRNGGVRDWNWWLRFSNHFALLFGSLLFCMALAVRPSLNQAGMILFVDRVTAMRNGYSVLPPVLLLCAAFLVHGFFALKRDFLGVAFKLDCPYPALAGDRQGASLLAQRCDLIHERAAELQGDLASFAAFRRRHWKTSVIGILLFLLAALLVGCGTQRTIEGPPWNVFFLCTFILAALLVLLTLHRFLAGWKDLKKILKLVALIPMVRAFDRMPRKTASLFGAYFFAHRPRSSHLVIPEHTLRQLQHEAAEHGLRQCRHEAAQTDRPSLSFAPALVVDSAMPRYADIPDKIAQRLQAKFFEYVEVASVHPHAGNGAGQAPEGVTEPTVVVQEESAPRSAAGFQGFGPWWQTTVARIKRWYQAAGREDDREGPVDGDYPAQRINRLTEQAQSLATDLQQYWPWHTVADAFGEQSTAGDTDKKTNGEPSARMPAWVEKAEDFVAIQAIIFLSQYFIQLRSLAFSMLWGALLLFMAATMYPFQPEALILYLVLALLGAAAGAVLWVLVQVNKNEVISRITRSTPNKFEMNWAFIGAALQIVLPIAIIVAAQVSGRLRTILDPLLNLFR